MMLDLFQCLTRLSFILGEKREMKDSKRVTNAHLIGLVSETNLAHGIACIGQGNLHHHEILSK